MGKRHASDSDNQCETPQKRQKVAPNSVSFAETPNSSPALNVSFTLTREFVDGTILTDLALKDWRIGKPIGKGSFGEIFLASDNVFKPVTSENAKYVVKIEPHSNGPLFVEIHALLNTAKRTETNIIPPGMPEYIASGSHYFKNERYRFLILKRYQRDLNSLIKNKRVDPKSVPIIACQILDVLEHLHDKGYVHSDIKAENLMIGKVSSSTVTSLKSTKFFDDVQKSAKKKPAIPSNGHNGLTSTPTVQFKKSSSSIEFSGSNPVRSCRSNGVAESETYQDMVKSHYLRPLKNIVYRDDSDDEDIKNGKSGGKRKRRKEGDDSRSFYYKVTTKNVNENLKQIDVQVSRNGTVLKAETKAASPDKKKPAVGPMEERIYLIDFGLASKFMDSTGQHRPFCMDQRRAHDGTLEFTSRDAHMGAHARRSDLECLGYNLIFWSRGFLPWKDEKLLNQPEQVHRMKEYFMTDVREMLKMIYGEDCPAYLGEFLHYVGGLTYDERPDYNYLRTLFYQELRRLGHNMNTRIKLNVHDIVKLSQPLNSQDEAEITNKINHVKSLMKLGVLPFRESTLHNKTTSPKNLRSKRDSARTPANGKPNGTTKNGSPIVNGKEKKEKKFSWAEILSTDPDQIARERAEKEFDRADQMEEVVIKYSGNPTYAIRELEHKRDTGATEVEYFECDDYIKGYTKPMMDILRKRQSQLMRDFTNSKSYSSLVKEPPDGKQANAKNNAQQDEEEEDDEEEEEDDDDEEEEDEDEEEEDVEQEEDAEVEENGSEEEEEDEEEEADSGNDDVDDEEEEEEELIHDKRKPTQGKHQESRKIGRKAKHTIRKDESDSDFINDAEEEEEEQEGVSEYTNMMRKKRNVRRRHFQSESSDQQDSDFNDQESSEYDSRDIRSKKRGRPRLNRDQSKPGLNQPYSKAKNGNHTKVPVIARNNNNNNNKPYYGDVDDSSHDVPSHQQKYRLVKRRKSGLRERIRPTDRSIKYHDDLQQKKSKRTPRKRYSVDDDYCQVDENSCSSHHTVTSVASCTTAASAGSDFSDCLRGGVGPKRKSSRKRIIRSYSNSSRSALSTHSRSSSLHHVANGVASNGHGGLYTSSGRAVFAGDDDEFFDDDDTRDMDYSPSKPKRRKTSAPRKTVSFKKKNGESKGPAAAATGAAAPATGAAAVAKALAVGVVAGLRGRRDHAIRTYSRG